MCGYRGNFHNSGPPSKQLDCCMHGRSHTRSPGVSIMRVDSGEFPLSAVPLGQLLPSHLGPPSPMLSNILYVKGCLDCSVGAFHVLIPVERSMCPYQRSIFSFRMGSRSAVPSRASSSVDLMLAVSCGLILQICLIIALSFRCRCWMLDFVNGQVSLAWSIAFCT